MPTPYAIAQEYTRNLIDSDIRATLNPAEVVAPCVLFVPSPVEINSMCGGTARMACVLIAPGPAQSSAWANLEELLAQVLQILPAETVTPVSYELRQSDQGLPAYQLEWDEPVDWTNEGES